MTAPLVRCRGTLTGGNDDGRSTGFSLSLPEFVDECVKWGLDPRVEADQGYSAYYLSAWYRSSAATIAYISPSHPSMKVCESIVRIINKRIGAKLI